MSDVAELQARIAQLEKEVCSLQKVSIFSDIQPVLEDSIIAKYKTVKVGTIGLSYRVKADKPKILGLIHQRIAEDLYKEIEDVQLLNPDTGLLLKGDEDLNKFEDDEGKIRLDFQYTAALCNHDDHQREHDDGDDLSDDDNFYNSCNCSHQH